jgi:phage/plasmid-like protein (TIGR03299 family)|tara:strand:- start:94 stop:1227 length:1134 start_codon:yes stop_codon:yes gene_type:complete
MAHNLEFNTDGIAMFATRKRNLQRVWWKGASFFSEDLVLDDSALTDDLFKAAGMDQHFVAQSNLIADHSGEIQRLIGLAGDLQTWDAKKLRALVKKVQASADPVESHRLVYREDDGKHLSVMGKDYTPVQVREAFGVLDALVESGEIVLETVGSLADGRKTFMAAKLTGADLEIVPGDIMERYLIVRDSYDGSTTLDFGASGTLIVCENTERMAFGEASARGQISKQKHTKGIMSEARIEQARKALGIASSSFEAYRETGQQLAAVKMTDSEVEAFHTKLIFGDKSIPGDTSTWSGQQRRSVGELGFMYSDGPGQDIEGRKGTAWGALNSVTAWTNHMKRHKASTDIDRTNFVLYGAGAVVNSQARELLLKQYQLAA